MPIFVFAVRLVGGPSVREGVVQVYYNKTWGWVCADQWDKRDADVACRMMGFLGASSVSQKSSAVKQGDLILMNNLQCTGNENSLFSCVRWLRNHSCISGYKAGVVCIVPEGRYNSNEEFVLFLNNLIMYLNL